MLGVAAARAALAPAPGLPAAPDAATRRALFDAMADAEPDARRRAAEAFPGDPWSEDDAFHRMEAELARTTASRFGVATSDVLDAVDQGIRERWPTSSGARLRVTASPCRPRPVD